MEKNGGYAAGRCMTAGKGVEADAKER